MNQDHTGTPGSGRADAGFECVEPELGARIGDLDLPDLSAESRQLLMGHLTICDRCRLVRDVTPLVIETLREQNTAGSGPIPRHRGRRRSLPGLRLGTVAGAALVAASFALLAILPPRIPSPGDLTRDGQAAPRLLRPLPGEIVPSDDVNLQWSPIRGATRYTVQLTEIGGDWRWSGTTEVSGLDIPLSAGLPFNRDIRVVVTTIPTDLLSPGALSGSFRLGRLESVAAFRLRHPPFAAVVTCLIGIAILVSSRYGAIRPRASR